VRTIDNINLTLRDDLMTVIKPGSHVSITATSFSIYAYQELRDQLSEVEELRFLFTSPSFTTEKADKQRREFYIPRLNRERDLFGSEFEIKLRNELSLQSMQLNAIENAKIDCCTRLFNEISTATVRYHKVTCYQDLLDALYLPNVEDSKEV